MHVDVNWIHEQKQINFAYYTVSDMEYRNLFSNFKKKKKSKTAFYKINNTL